MGNHIIIAGYPSKDQLQGASAQIVSLFFHLCRKLDAARVEARKAGGSVVAAVEQTQRVYGYRLVLAGALRGSVYGISRGLLEMEIAERWLRVAIALAPIPFFVRFLWMWMTGLSTMDELERRIQPEALALAFPLMAVLLMTFGLLEIAAGLNPDDWSCRHVRLMMPALYYAGLWRAKRRYE
ncbi:MAG: hypothetical protein EXQ50_11570 [Acidobacteria bacterium]|nr:hypothetical protein [Acidobacteriota bacterium]MSO62709.1 hypothetical protein [Acidobacteriota bacterium]